MFYLKIREVLTDFVSKFQKLVKFISMILTFHKSDKLNKLKMSQYYENLIDFNEELTAGGRVVIIFICATIIAMSWYGLNLLSKSIMDWYQKPNSKQNVVDEVTNKKTLVNKAKKIKKNTRPLAEPRRSERLQRKNI